MILEESLSAEEIRLKNSNFGGMLYNQVFHKGFYVCAAVCVIFSRRNELLPLDSITEFCQISQIIDIHPYNILKILEQLVKLELPHDMIDRLLFLSERILDTLAWSTEESPLFSFLQSTPPEVLDEAIELTMMEVGFRQPQKDAKLPRSYLSECFTPAKRPTISRQQIDSPFRSSNVSPAVIPLSPPPLPHEQRTGAKKTFEYFMKRVFFVVARRVQSLMVKLRVSNEQERVTQLALSMLAHHATETALSHGIDTVILCSLFGVSMASRLGLKWNNIMEVYMKQHHARTEV
eukprot:TRINITY_DN351_c3_g1_i2.p1 TRINITY_DN351_c3_g1~~TRINITY_DN351_c3_g1_i2.p1  ORF type:complete len:322 (+),score=100.42 TRINITY_DN351_c3_g1_i2:94-966(+)